MRWFKNTLLAVCVIALLGDAASAQRRLFMSEDGEQADQPTSGNTSVDMMPGETVHIGAFITDDTGMDDKLNAYQAIYPYFAEPQGDAEGTVNYVNVNPGSPGGDSILVDPAREDWVFAGEIALPSSYNETDESIFGVFHSLVQTFTVDVVGGPFYLLEFDLVASEDACGEHEFRWNVPPKNPPLSSLFNDFGANIAVDEFQALTVNLPACGGGGCEPPDCNDDDPCTVDACVEDTCVNDPVDCSEAGDDCNTASCNGGGADGNCDILQMVEDGTPCNGGKGTCMAGVCEGGGCPAGDLNFVDPVDGVVDARQPHPVGSLDPQQGIDTIVVDGPAGAGDSCWTLCETSDGGLGANDIADVTEDNGTYTITLMRPITPNAVTTITYDGGEFGEFISHPANANADNVADPMDIIAIIDYLNGMESPFGVYSTDIDHSSLLHPLDILALIDLLNGADSFDPQNGSGLPECNPPCCFCEADADCADTKECTIDSCDTASGSCQHDPVEDGTPCNNGKGECMGGFCEQTGGCDPPDCNDDDACTVDACVDDACVNDPVDCSGAGDDCNIASCDGAGDDGNCDTLDPVEDGTSCNEGKGECMAGVCEPIVGGCEPPDCNDDDACTVDACVDDACVNDPVDCSGDGDDCNIASCDAGGDDGNCDNLDPVEDGTSCNNGKGECMAGVCEPIKVGPARRVFMARDGEQADQPATGNTSITMEPGEVARIGVFVDDTLDDMVELNAYQVMVQDTAGLLDGAGGDVIYVDNAPGQPGGDSVFVDPEREDWVFAGEIVLPSNYNESPGIGLFGVFHSLVQTFSVDIDGGPFYMLEFDISASADACGNHEVRFNLEGDPPPLSSLFNAFGGNIMVDDWQQMTVVLPPCE